MSFSPTIVGIAVGVAILILIVFFLRLLAWARKPKKTPLPPIQALAHHRQRQQLDLYERQSVYLECDPVQVLPSSLPVTPTSYNPFVEKGRISSGDFASPNAALRRYSSEGMNSRSSASVISSGEELGTSESRGGYDRRASRLRPMSSLSSIHSSTIRGPPHAPHNRVELVMPAPLAGQLQDGGLAHSNRTSLYDQWTPPLSRSTSQSRRSFGGSAEELVRVSRSSRRSQSHAVDGVELPPIPPVPALPPGHTPSPPPTASSRPSTPKLRRGRSRSGTRDTG